MTVIFTDWLHWTFPKNKNPLKDHLRGMGVECIDLQPCKIGHNNRALLDAKLHDKAKKYYRGFDVDSLIKVGVARESGWYSPDKKVVEKYRKWAMFLIDWAFKTFKEHQPDYVVVEGGLTYLARTVAEVARELGVNLICVENSFIRNKCFIDFNTGYIVNRHKFARCSGDWIDTRYLTNKKKEEFDEIYESVWGNLTYQTKHSLDTSIFSERDKSIFVPLQVYDDQVTLYDTPFNNEQFIEKILELARTHFKDWNVIFKCHPKEEKFNPRPTGDFIESKKLPENVFLLRGAKYSENTQELIKFSDMVFVNNSQAGLEACLLNKPVVVFGDAFYSRKGFTIDYHPNFDWEALRSDYKDRVNQERVQTWFYYFYKWLYNKNFMNVDRIRVNREMNLK